MLGKRISNKKVLNTFGSLGMKCETTEAGWRVKAPTHRFDVSAEHDLVEEVARLVGYDQLPLHRPKVSAGQGLAPETKMSLGRVKDLLVDLGYREAITYSFVSPDLQRHLPEYRSAIRLKNPISVHMAQMRVSLLPGLLEALATNSRRQLKDIRLFETGHIYRKKKNSTEERQRLAGVLTGSSSGIRWDQPVAPADFFDAKGDVERLLSFIHRGIEPEFVPIVDKAYQAGQCAQIRVNGKEIGRLGRISDALLEEIQVGGRVFGFELDWGEIESIQPPQYSAVSRYPAVTRDISIVIPEETVSAEATEVIEAASGDLLVDLRLIDLYADAGIERGKKSLTYRLTLQSNYRNLTDEEADQFIDTVLASLEEQVGATLRSG